MIGWYVHHHGRGHLTRAAVVRPHVAEPVTVLSSLGAPVVHDFHDWVQLDRDDDVSDAPIDPRAHGRLHWVPVGSHGLSRRMAVIAGWIATHRPRLMVVDVSVEVTLIARLCGIPVIVLAGPGDRSDPAHQLGFDVADALIAAWPREIYVPDHLVPHLSKTTFVGAFSRFDACPVRPATDTGEVLVLNGAGGTAITAGDISRAQRSTPLYRWTSVGLPGGPWSEDVWARLGDAAAVVTHAGQNALAEVAAARRPAIVVAQDRPFDEQRRVAAALARHEVAVSVPEWPEADDWPMLLDTARDLGGDRWAAWNDTHGAARAGAVINATGRA